MAPPVGLTPKSTRVARLAAWSAPVDVLAFALLWRAGLGLEAAQATAYALTLALAAALLRQARGGDTRHARVGVTLVIVLLAYAMRAGMLSLAAISWQWPAPVAIVPAALAGALVLRLGLTRLAFVPHDGDGSPEWKAAALLAIAYLFGLRLVYLGQLELIPQEAYYWNYAQHLDIGYLDHPPLAAWMIALATSLRDGEFFVRLPAVAAWCLTATFVALYARDAAGPAVALKAVLLASTLPFFFLTGWFMTPDALLTAAWAAALYCLQRALVDGHQRAWIGAGIAIGVGMLAKYPMILVPAAALAYVLFDAKSRRVLLSPWAWSGVLAAALVFSPVIVWNLQHEWASFAFQGSRRLTASGTRFDLHRFVLYAVAIVSPWAVAGLVISLARWRREARGTGAAATPATTGSAAPADAAAETARRRWWFIVVFTLVPLAAFAVPSFWARTKLHWTGPIWLAALPAIAASLPPAGGGNAHGIAARLLARTWVPMLHALMVGYALVLFYYPVWGLAGIRALPSFVATPWRNLREQVQVIEDEVLRETGRRPAIVGLDKHNIADQMTFYDPRGDGALDTSSRHLFFTEDTLMYQRWFPAATYAGRDLVVVSRHRGDVDDRRLDERAMRLGPVRTLELTRQGAHAGRAYARVVYGYRAPARPAAPPVPAGAGSTR